MPDTVSTDSVRPSERQAFWTEAVCRAFAKVEPRPLRPGAISGHFEVVEIGNAKLARFVTSPQAYSRSARLVSSAGSDDFMFDVQLAGRSRMIQGSREGAIQPGYGVLYDARRPFDDLLDSHTAQRPEVLMVTVPAAPLLAALPDAERLSATPIPLSGAAGRAITRVLRSVVVEGAGEATLSRPNEADVIAYLRALLRLAREGTLRLARWHLFTLLDAHIRLSLGEPQRPADLAGLFRISERTLHRSFADAHTTFERHLLHRRVERLREMLSQPCWARFSIGRLAIECGFADAAHASRTFRAHFLVTPRDYRACVLDNRESQLTAPTGAPGGSGGVGRIP
jgi:AraC family transcriptional activator of tynA and feaB